MSNKLKKEKKIDKSKNDFQDKTIINETDPAFIKILKKRLQMQSQDNPKRNFFTSNILYFIIELAIIAVFYKFSLNGNEAIKEFYRSILIVCGIISVYNIVVSGIQIKKYKYRKTGNIILIVLQSLIFIMSFSLLLF